MLSAPNPFGGTAVEVGDTPTVICTVELGGSGDTVSAVMTSAAGSDTLTGFKVQMQGYAGGEWIDYIQTADWPATDIWVKKFTTENNPATLQAEQSAGFIISCAGFYAVRFAANCGTGESATITIGGGVSGGGY